MKRTLYDYREQILKLPVKEKYSKDELLIPDFLMEQEEKLEIYYAPHNEYSNPKAKVFIIGITPGFQQMSTAISAARKGLLENKEIPEIQYECKAAGRFSGVIRKNIIAMLDEIGLCRYFSLDSCQKLFDTRDELLHTVSLIPYSVFVNKQNYSGHTPKILSSELLKKYVYENFLSEYESLEEKEIILLVPLGRAVEEVLIQLEEENLIHRNQILRDFPHPSGANVNRIPQLNANKAKMIQFLDHFFD